MQGDTKFQAPNLKHYIIYSLKIGNWKLEFPLRSSGMMPRIAGVNIPEQKKIKIALTYIYGIGHSLSREILQKAEIYPEKRAKDLTSEEVSGLKEIIEKNYKIEGELRRKRMVDVKRLKDISSWRGIRHLKGLPVRGQTTRTNSRTVRGNVRKTVGSGRKPPPAPK